ncbi:MAG TPA: FAD-binding oxidoreductase [Polyangiaceae bacterium]|nr:FAD-binding oxidoreductase [Polyangiaceae bacterium]
MARVSVLRPDLEAYARDVWPRGLIELASGHPRGPVPDAIVWPESIEAVAALVRLARREGFSLIPFGAGSGVCGGIRGGDGRVVVDLKRMSSWSIRPGPELDVGAGALGIQLEEALLHDGYTIGHYPSSILCSTTGGWVAARGAGQCSGRYGKIEDMVTFVEAVLGTGEPVLFRRREHGPNLVPLLVGSEGTLGVITRVGLRLHPAPAARAYAAFAFDDFEQGITAVRRAFQEGLRPAVTRLYDPLDTLLFVHGEDAPRRIAKEPGPVGLRAGALRAVLSAPGAVARALALAERSLLSRSALIVVHEGDAGSVEREARAVDAICRSAGGRALGEGPARAWFRRRYSVSYRQSPLFRGGAFSDTMEVAAPWARVPDVYRAVRRSLGEHVLVMAHLSHAYPDGSSLYFTFAGVEHGGRDAFAVYDDAWRAALTAAMGAGATLSHHHGVGRSKAPRLTAELGAGVAVVRALKAAWDPSGVLNPGALIPPPSDAERVEAPPAPREPFFDAVSGLAELPGDFPLGEARAWIEARGHVLPLASNVPDDLSVDSWIARGMPGLPDRYADPVYTPLPGFYARLHDGRRFVVRPSPRRAVGPDLSALFVGAEGAFGQVERALLVVSPRGARGVEPLAWSGERNPPLGADERAAFDSALRVLSPPASPGDSGSNSAE